MSYTVSQWLLLFFMYSFFGWIWESCFVSVRKREWVNRGFLYGPAIPIYGFGAIIILWLTLPARRLPVLVYVLGMLGATALELGVGALMEKIFHMRWWDYSKNPLNFKGYICLGCSLGWGVFSLLLVYVLHPPIERLMLRVPEVLAQILVDVGLVVIAGDTVKSVQAALDMRELLERLKEDTGRRRDALEEKLEQRRGALEEKLEQRRDAMEEKLERLRMYRERELRRAAGILHRNPTAFSERHQRALERLRELSGKKPKK